MGIFFPHIVHILTNNFPSKQLCTVMLHLIAFVSPQTFTNTTPMLGTDHRTHQMTKKHSPKPVPD